MEHFTKRDNDDHLTAKNVASLAGLRCIVTEKLDGCQVMFHYKNEGGIWSKDDVRTHHGSKIDKVEDFNGCKVFQDVVQETPKDHVKVLSEFTKAKEARVYGELMTPKSGNMLGQSL